jgi:tetratricopeptide (TPR) repeat protein
MNLKKMFVVILLYSIFTVITLGSHKADPIVKSVSGLDKADELLRESRFEESEAYARSVLNDNPNDSKAEFILTQSWIGLGRVEKTRGHFAKAKDYFEKAYFLWPLNQEIKFEIEDLQNKIKSSKNYSSHHESKAHSNTVVLIDPGSLKSVEEMRDELSIILKDLQVLKNINLDLSVSKYSYLINLVLSLFNFLFLLIILKKMRGR